MRWNFLGQGVDVVLSVVLTWRLIHLRLQWKYPALLTFVICDGLLSAAYILSREFQPVDYRIFYFATLVITWLTTIWAVYALMVDILKQFPGIKRFCLWFLNLVFVAWVAISLWVIQPEWAKYSSQYSGFHLAKLVALAQILDRAFSLAEILVILSILAFVLRFPIVVARNLAAFSAALAVDLFSRISYFLLVTYLPDVRQYFFIRLIPPTVTAACLAYWLFKIDLAGEETKVTLGRGWQSVPEDHIIEQLEAMNAALLRSREQS